MKYWLFSVVIFMAVSASAQDMKKFNLYHPEENAAKALESAIAKAKEEGKHVFIQIGGNWCIWCARFNDYITKDSKIDTLLRDGYITYHLNYSTENKNEKLLEKYRFPQRFGFPVFLILDGNGNLLHTQNSEYLEEDKSYNREKVIAFFRNWNPSALHSKNYTGQ